MTTPPATPLSDADRLEIARAIAAHKRDPESNPMPPLETLRALVDSIRIRRADFVSTPSRKARSPAGPKTSTATPLDFSDLGF